MSSTIEVYLHIVAVLVVMIGAFNWGVVAWTSGHDLFSLLGAPAGIILPIYALVAVAGLYLALDRNTWLPFLGDAVFPASVVRATHPKDASTAVTLRNLQPGAPVVYWASEEAKPMTRHASVAYGDYSNAGVVYSNSRGQATALVKCPSRYTVGWSKVLPRHIHYRILRSNGMMGEVNTKRVDC